MTKKASMSKVLPSRQSLGDYGKFRMQRKLIRRQG